MQRTYSDKEPGLFSVSRFDPDTGREYVMAYNTSTVPLVTQVEVEATFAGLRVAARTLPAGRHRSRQPARRTAAAGFHRLRRDVALMRAPLAALLLSLALPAAAEAPEALPAAASPGKVLEVAVTLDYAGRPGYSVAYRGRPLIEDSRLGFLLTDAPKLERSFKVESSATRSFDETWEQPWGERRFVRNHYNELRVRLRETRSPFRALDVVFRLYDDGLGFRYEFPDQPALQQVNIADELTEFALAEPATAWWIPAGEWNRYEYLYERTPAKEVGQAHTPMTLRTASGVHLAFHEAALVDYSGMWLRRVTGQRFKATLAPSAEGPRVRRTAPFATPWRTIQVSDRAGGLYESNLVLNLNEPNALGDVSWFTPAKYVGVWWSLQLGTETWGSGPTHGATTANVKRYIDFAAENGFRGVLVEGWNTGWDREWYFADRTEFSFTQAHPDFDLEALSAYARERGVHLIGHHETGGFVSDYQAQLAAALDLYARNGVDVIKMGYVADAGGLTVMAPDGSTRYEWHDGQFAARHHLKVVQEAARRRIAIKDHEPIKDTGLRRTYPNWISREGARGMEYNAWADPSNPPEHEVNLFFTRMLVGADGLHARRAEPGRPRRPADPVHDRPAIGPVPRHLQPAADGRRPAGELPALPGSLPVHPRRADRLGRHARARRRGRRLRRRRAQGPPQRRLVPRRGHGRAGA